MPIEINIPGFELIKEIGAGGMAKVYLGMQTLLERQVAIKILHQKLSMESEEFKKRFFYEGKVLAKLQHDNIVSIIDIGEADGMLYMIMEYVEGGTLADHLKVQQLTVDQAIQICTKVGLALHATHLKHIVHRDMKPSNILLRDINTPLLTDFGIARQTDTDQGLTQTGHIVGTMQYMSPEQIRGMHIDHRSDIYSLGLMFYRLLVGRLPFNATSQYDLSRMQCEDPPPPLPENLADIQQVMDTMLAKDREDRFSTCLEFCKAVQSLPAINEEYMTELTQQTRILDASQLSQSNFDSRNQSGQYTDRTTGGRSGGYTDRHSDQYSERSSGTRIMPGGTGDRSQRSQRYEQQGSGKLKKILMFGTPALAIVVSLLLYFSIWYEPPTGLTDQELRRVDNYLKLVDGYISTNRYEEPQDDNAITELKKALDMAPNYGPALEFAEDIAEYFEFKATDLKDEGKLEEASEEIAKGLELSPGFETLVRLEEEIGGILTERQRQADITDAVALAASYEALGNYTEPEGENAYSAYQQVIALDPSNLQASRGLKAILSQLVFEIEQSIETDNLDLANNQVTKAATYFPNEGSVTQLRTQINNKRTMIREQQEVDEYLVKARGELDAGQMISPETDNALASFNEVLKRQPENEEASNGLAAIAAHFADLAGEAMGREEFTEALRLVDNGLLAVPDDANLLSIQQQSTGQLGEREREIQSVLQQAHAAIVARNFLPPGENALDLFKSVEDLDPGNSQAATGISRLPDQVYDDASGRRRLGDLRGAGELLAAAQISFPEQARFAELNSDVEQALAQRGRANLLQDLLDESASVVAMRPVTLDSIDRAAGVLKEINAEFPGNLTAVGHVTDLVAAIRSEVLKPGASEEAGFALVDRALSHFERSNLQLVSTRDTLERNRTARLAEAERQRLALMGQLAIDAVPWGQVTEIKNADGTVQELPGINTTPLLVSLMAGRYTVSITNSDGGPPQNLSVNVVAQQVATTTAEFNSLTADEYFERANW